MNWKSDSYNAMFVIIDLLIKMVYYELVKITIDTTGLIKVIINMIVKYHNLFKSIIGDQGLLFTSKF